MSSNLARYNVIASFPNMEVARKGIEALQFAGVDAAHISLLGQSAEDAAAAAAEEKLTTPRDQPMALRLVARAIVGGALGFGAGLLIGILVTALGLGFPGLGSSPAIQIASWAMFGVIVGTLVSAYSGISIAEGWELTFEPVPEEGAVLVGVHSDIEKEAGRAEKVLRSHEALKVSRLDSRGNPLPTS